MAFDLTGLNRIANLLVAADPVAGHLAVRKPAAGLVVGDIPGAAAAAEFAAAPQLAVVAAAVGLHLPHIHKMYLDPVLEPGFAVAAEPHTAHWDRRHIGRLGLRHMIELDMARRPDLVRDSRHTAANHIEVAAVKGLNIGEAAET